MVNTPGKELDDLRKELKKETPEALHTILPEKEDKSKAKATFLCRKGKRTPICPLLAQVLHTKITLLA